MDTLEVTPMTPAENMGHLTDQPQGTITLLLGEIAVGIEAAKEQLVALVYDKLHRMAGAIMQGDRINHTLQPTALVHEAYFKLFVGKPLPAVNRAYFFGAAATAMRQILIDYARKRSAHPEGKRVEFLEGVLDTIKSTCRLNMLDLDCALEELKGMHARQGEVVVLRFFGGLQWNEIATCLNVSTSTVEKDWQAARAWLYRSLKGNDAGTLDGNKRSFRSGA
jgi:RNA polymerase sigma-70 factor (ECF subfamily)